MTSIYDKKKADDFSAELNTLLLKYGLKISLGLNYTKQAVFPYMELVPMVEEGDKEKENKKIKEEPKKNGEVKLKEELKYGN